MWSTECEFDQFYNMFETLLLKDSSGFLKTALEVGYQAKNLKAVYSIFEEYSKVIRVFVPLKTQKQIEKIKTEVVIKFIRFILLKRLKQFTSFDFTKIEAKWNPSYEASLSQLFSVKDSVFHKHLTKVVSEKKFDLNKFKKYWLIMAGKDAGLLRKFYDNALLSYDRFSKSISTQDAKIRAVKSKIGIKSKCDTTEMKFRSLMNPIPDKHIEKLFSEYLGKYETRGTRSMSSTDKIPATPSVILKPVLKEEFSKIPEVEDAGEDRDTLASSESTSDLINEFSQIFKNKKQCWEERTMSMKKKTEKIIFQAVNLERRASM